MWASKIVHSPDFPPHSGASAHSVSSSLFTVQPHSDPSNDGVPLGSVLGSLLERESTLLPSDFIHRYVVSVTTHVLLIAAQISLRSRFMWPTAHLTAPPGYSNVVILLCQWQVWFSVRKRELTSKTGSWVTSCFTFVQKGYFSWFIIAIQRSVWSFSKLDNDPLKF